MTNKLRLAALLIAVLLLTACATGPTSNVYESVSALAPPLEASAVLLPADVTVSEYTAGGVIQPRADWSDSVIADLDDALQFYLYDAGVRFEPYGDELLDEHVPFIRQTNLVLDAMQHSQTTSSFGTGNRDYRIPQAELDSLRSFGTDYAIVLQLSSNRGTGGRIALAFIGAIAGAAVETSNAQFRCALIDLRDGQVKWANFDNQALVDIGDVLNASPEKWEESIRHLMSGFPL